MKWLAVLTLALSLLAGCAQVFSGNLFKSIDKAPVVNTSSVSALLKADPASFKGDPTALAAAQKTLAAGFSDTALAAATTPAAKAALVTDAQAYVLTTAFSSDAGTVVSDAVKQISNLTSGSGGDVTTAVDNLFAGQSKAQIQATLDQFVNISGALTAMQKASVVTGSTIDPSTFLGTKTDGDFVQTALIAGAVAALVSANTDTATLAAALASGGSITPPDHSLTDPLNAKTPPPATGAGSDYAYMYTLMQAIKP